MASKYIRLGSKVKCKFTGFVGIATRKIEEIDESVQYFVQPEIAGDRKWVDGQWINGYQLEIASEAD